MGRLEEDHRRYKALNEMFGVLFPVLDGSLQKTLLQMGTSGRKAAGYISFSGGAAIVNSNAAQELVRRGLYRAQDFAVFLKSFPVLADDVRKAAEACGANWSQVVKLAGVDVSTGEPDGTETIGISPPETEGDIDVVIITALSSERDAVLALVEGWKLKKDSERFPYHQVQIPREGKKPLGVAVAWSGAMGREAVIIRGLSLLKELKPNVIAMSGICAGMPGDVFLGDVIVADRVFNYDTGKQRERLFEPDIMTFNLKSNWKAAVELFQKTWKGPKEARPLSMAYQKEWLLRALHRSADLDEESVVDTNIPSWTEVIDALVEKELINIDDELVLTDTGRSWVKTQRIRVRKQKPDPDFRVHIGPIAVGAAVVSDPEVFKTLKKGGVRKTLGLEMETSGIAQIADRAGIPSLLVKAVVDYADGDKDDQFHAFAVDASARFVIDFLSYQLD